jgi:3-hydroxybutyryl-CoA dehydratase
MTSIPEPGAELTTRGRTITESDLVSFSSLTGDWHPQHGDAQWAASSRFGERVAHGMLVMAYAVGLMPFDPERVVALRGLDAVTFKRPVRIGDTIRVRSRVESTRQLDDQHELVSLAWRVVNQRDEIVARARVDALWKVDASRAGNGKLPDTAESEAERGESEENLVLL